MDDVAEIFIFLINKGYPTNESTLQQAKIIAGNFTGEYHVCTREPRVNHTQLYERSRL
jgi:hypothetical protein